MPQESDTIFVHNRLIGGTFFIHLEWGGMADVVRSEEDDIPISQSQGPLHDTGRAINRIGMLVVHSNPLSDPGSGDAGGMTVYVRQVARSLARRGIEVDIYTRRDSEDSPEECELYPGVTLTQIAAGPTDLRKEQIAEYLPEFTENLMDRIYWKGSCYELIHSHYWLSGRVGSILSRNLGVGFVHTFHTLGRVKNHHAGPLELLEPEHRLIGEEKVIAAADAIVASTVEEKRWLIDLYGAHPDRVFVIPPGVDHELFSPGDPAVAKRRLGLLGRKTLLFVGRLQPLKAADTAVKALARLTQRIPELTLMIVGGPSGAQGEAELMRLRELTLSLGVEDRVRFFPAKPQGELPLFYRAADVVVVPSRVESFGLVALEAQASGVPVVASTVGGLKSIVGEGESGFLVETDDDGMFAHRIESILLDDELSLSIGRGALESSRRFSWDRCAVTLHELYQVNSRSCSDEKALAG